VRIILGIFLIIAIGALSWYLYQLYQQRRVLADQSEKLLQEIQPLEKENQELTAELKRLEDPENLEIELREAGYASPGEKVLIIVPKED